MGSQTATLVTEQTGRVKTQWLLYQLFFIKSSFYRRKKKYYKEKISILN